MGEKITMKIKISAQDYFNELKLMEKQYGQEEDLYPWIYMLLQMAEYKKRETEGENKYQAVSIRDAHNAKVISKDNRDDSYWKVRWELTKRVGAPDLAIFSKDKETIIGCVEVKGLGDDLFVPNSQLDNLSITLPTPVTYILGYDGRCRGNIPGYRIEDEKYMEEIRINAKEIKENGNYIIEEKTTTEDIEEIVKDILCNGSEKLLTRIGEKNGWKYDTKELPAGEESNQLAGHLDKFKKVLFTNGLDFYYLKSSDDNRVTVDWNVQLCPYEVFKNSPKDKIPDGFKENFDILINNLSKLTDWYKKA